MIGAVGVVVPVHEEQDLLPACLASLHVAVRHPALRGLEVHVVPVLDACSDDSGAFAPGGIVLNARNVGRARAAGFAEVLRREAGRPVEEIWLATTDADSTVPADWLAVQLMFARTGVEVVAGTVAVEDWSQQPSAAKARFAETYGVPGDGHVHVHGANLGLCAAAYVDAGGVPPLAVAEDRALVASLRGRARRLVATGRAPVVTSARRESRTEGGFADHLRGLAEAIPPPDTSARAGSWAVGMRLAGP